MARGGSLPSEASRPRMLEGDLPWSDSLAGAHSRGRYRIEQILFGLVRDRFQEFGWGEGDVLICVDNARDIVSLVGPDGAWRRLERAYARFVKVRYLGTLPRPRDG